MKKVNTFGIQFVIRKHRIKEGKAPIYARVTVNSSRCEISVKRKILISSWNNGKGVATGKSPEITALNAYLEQVRSQLAGHYQDLVSERKKVTAEAVKNRFIGFDESEKTLIELIDFHNIRMNSKKLFYHQKICGVIPEKEVKKK